LQSISEPGAVLLSEAAYRLVDGLVEATFVGEHRLKGRTGPERVYRLEAIRGASRFDASLKRGLTAFVGRDRELDALQKAEQSGTDYRSGQFDFGLRVQQSVEVFGLKKSNLQLHARFHFVSVQRVAAENS